MENLPKTRVRFLIYGTLVCKHLSSITAGMGRSPWLCDTVGLCVWGEGGGGVYEVGYVWKMGCV